MSSKKKSHAGPTDGDERAIYNDTAAFMKSLGLDGNGDGGGMEFFDSNDRSFEDAVTRPKAKSKTNIGGKNSAKVSQKEVQMKSMKKGSKAEKVDISGRDEDGKKKEKGGKNDQHKTKGAKGARWGKGVKSVQKPIPQTQTPAHELETSRSGTEIDTTYWWKKNNRSSQAAILVSRGDEQIWYNVFAVGGDFLFDDTAVSTASQEKKLSGEKFSEIVSNLEIIFSREVDAYQKRNAMSQNADRKWMEDVIRSGTLSDRVAALTLKIQESPCHELDSLDALLSMAERKEQRTSQMALEAIKDLLIHNLLPDRKLKAFKDHQHLLLDARMNISLGLACWYESQLKLRVERLLRALEQFMRSNINYFKKNCMNIGTFFCKILFFVFCFPVLFNLPSCTHL